MEIRHIFERKKKYLDLLLLADEQEDMIDKYLNRGDLFVMADGGEPLAVAVVTEEGEGICELKNLAVSPEIQGKGYGRQMVDYLARRYGVLFHTMLVGTGDSPKTLPFYHRCGFQESHRIRDFFTDHYDHPIVEGGVQLVDMVVLKRPLWVMETPRLGFRRLCFGDQNALRSILGDKQTMYAWEYGFSDAQIKEWIEKCQIRYSNEGYAYFAAIDKESDELIGLMGPLNESIDDSIQLGIGYIVAKCHWHKGYAYEGAKGWLDYCFDTLGAEQVIADIRPENTASCKVAQRLGMSVIGQHVKYVEGKEMPHLIYALNRGSQRVAAHR